MQVVEPKVGRRSPVFVRLWLLFVLVAGALVLGAGAEAGAASVTVQWDANTEPDLIGYTIHYGLASNTYTTHLNVGKTTIHAIGGLSDNTVYFFAVTARDSFGNESGYSNEVQVTTAAATQETVTIPSTPSGPATGDTGASLTYTTNNSVSSAGHATQYRFSWADGTDSGWLPAGTTSASHSWSAAATYDQVKVQARCATDTSVVSEFSTPFTVTISTAAPSTITPPSAPTGPASGSVGTELTYGTGGATCSTGDAVQYRFAWADGTVSDWSASPSATKVWSVPGTFDVKAEARCAAHDTVTSQSAALTVTMSGTLGDSQITSPAAPVSPANPVTTTLYSFSTGGSTSSICPDAIQYRFLWGDGTVSDWIPPGQPATASKAWAVAGTYAVQAEAACASDPRISALSAPVQIAVTQKNPLLFADDFKNGNSAGDPEWKVLSGIWSGVSKALASTNVRVNSIIVPKTVKNFLTGRLETTFKLPYRLFMSEANAGLIFHIKSATSYRYVTVSNTKVVIGQVGNTPKVTAGVKKGVRKAVTLGQWHKLRVDTYADGTVKVYVDDLTKPAMTYKFADLVPGLVGYLSRRSNTSYDNFKAWDAAVLP